MGAGKERPIGAKAAKQEVKDDRTMATIESDKLKAMDRMAASSI
eukprot:CAMPEP_0178856172 /NCGR_PEP_ID=MMETSP0746-20121128/23795_1 /TAXON_ID=913974 /ORGANISM="Nitzschia punctata, Strain CCMP561" /LENGTH=43 /DNA_ID= /DNA_START= /DNA_END= /DNA_ORIENTATION=